jgi:hypothetical protein
MILGLRVHHHSLMVPEYQMPGGVSTAAAIPLLDGGTWARMCWRMSPSVRGMVEGTMVTVKPASMLFGGEVNRRSVGVFRLVSRLILESA